MTLNRTTNPQTTSTSTYSNYPPSLSKPSYNDDPRNTNWSKPTRNAQDYYDSYPSSTYSRDLNEIGIGKQDINDPRSYYSDFNKDSRGYQVRSYETNDWQDKKGGSTSKYPKKQFSTDQIYISGITRAVTEELIANTFSEIAPIQVFFFFFFF